MMKRFTDLRFTIGAFLTLLSIIVFSVFFYESNEANAIGGTFLGVVGVALILSTFFGKNKVVT